MPKVLLDTNIYISAFLFPSRTFDEMFLCIEERCELYISTYIIEEFARVADRKFPEARGVLEKFLVRNNHVLIETPLLESNDTESIRDPQDYPILHDAIAYNIDVIVTGDKDFHALTSSQPAIMSIREFLDIYRAG